jgi:hypothetical protein
MNILPVFTYRGGVRGVQEKQKQPNIGVKCTKGFEKMCKSCHILREKGIIH